MDGRQDARLLRGPDLARRIGVPIGWLKAEADAGRLPHVRAGSRYLFDRDLVERMILARASGPSLADEADMAAARRQTAALRELLESCTDPDGLSCRQPSREVVDRGWSVLLEMEAETGRRGTDGH